MVNQTLVRIAKGMQEGMSLEDIARDMGVEVQWLGQVMGTHGYLVVKELVEKGEV